MHMSEVLAKGKAAKSASYQLIGLSTEVKNEALEKVAQRLVLDKEYILAENKKDLEMGRQKGPGSWLGRRRSRHGTTRPSGSGGALDPGPASGPLDGVDRHRPGQWAVTIPAIGFCAPTSGDEQPTGPARVTAWHVVDGVARTIRLRQIAPVGVTTPFGALYGPATTRRGTR